MAHQLRNQAFWWDALFRFTREEFFNDLLPLLHVPEYFSVEGHVCEGPLAILMLLAKLSAPRPLRPDMEVWFRQDKTRLSRFIRAAMQFMFRSFSYTLVFDDTYLRGLLPMYAQKIAMAIGVPEPDLFRCWGFVDGVFRSCVAPTGE